MSNIKVGNVLELFISVSGKSKRENQLSLSLDSNGVLGDKFYGKNIERSVLITSKHSYDLATKNAIEMQHSDLGENILIDYNPYQLPTNSKFKIGDAILEISHHCTLCKSLVKVDRRLPKLLKDDRGIFAKVIQDGEIKKGDDIYII